jgi:hypothetical protein
MNESVEKFTNDNFYGEKYTWSLGHLSLLEFCPCCKKPKKMTTPNMRARMTTTRSMTHGLFIAAPTADRYI